MLNRKRKLFCEEYIKDLNASEAAKRAGYIGKDVRTTACSLLKKPECSEYIKELQSATAERNRITVDDLIHDLDEIRKADLKDLYDEDGNLKGVNRLPSNVTRIIQEHEVTTQTIIGCDIEKTRTKYKFYSKLEAIEKLAKHLGFYERDNIRTLIHDLPVKLIINREAE